MAKVVYTDWRDRAEEPEIIGVFEDNNAGYNARSKKEDELKEEGYDIDEEVHVWIEEVEIVRDETLSNEEINLVMNAIKGLSKGHSIVAFPGLIKKVEHILKKYNN